MVIAFQAEMELLLSAPDLQPRQRGHEGQHR
jgi:hypothetical protein